MSVNTGLIFLIFLLGICISEASIPDIIMPGLNANQECRSNHLVGRCVPKNQCKNEHKNIVICDYFDAQLFVCCPDGKDVNSRISNPKPPLKERCKESYRKYKLDKIPKLVVREGLKLVVREGPKLVVRERQGLTEDESTTERVHKIIAGGIDALADEFPFMAVLVWQSTKDSIPDFSCGGTLISEKFVLTAAHCASLDGEPPKYIQVGGKELSRASEDNIPVKRIIVHPDYDPNYAYHDLALIELQKETSYPFACLWLQSEKLPLEPVTAIGYGKLEFAGGDINSKVLQKVNLTVYSQTSCRSFFPPGNLIPLGVTDNQFCAGDNGGIKDTCQGDSGGALLRKQTTDNDEYYSILGVTSFGGACSTGSPGIFIRPSQYLKWIETVVV